MLLLLLYNNFNWNVFQYYQYADTFFGINKSDMIVDRDLSCDRETLKTCIRFLVYVDNTYKNIVLNLYFYYSQGL